MKRKENMNVIGSKASKADHPQGEREKSKETKIEKRYVDKERKKEKEDPYNEREKENEQIEDEKEDNKHRY